MTQTEHTRLILLFNNYEQLNNQMNLAYATNSDRDAYYYYYTETAWARQAFIEKLAEHIE
ncbi:hypothetical protein PP427_gp274 [Salmonella phage KM16]|uniref:hypothetical protein n=1 Tax=Salmonella phage KM16 TaxID=2797303 RepID=UPI0024909CED|nr:hypothetical protein PP427_gp274 [Salmonella phage KM16]